MAYIHVALSTDNPHVYEAVNAALAFDRMVRQGFPAVLIDGAPTHCEVFINVGPIMMEARRRAEDVRVRRKAAIGVGFAHGPARLRLKKRPSNVAFTFYCVVAAVDGGATSFSIPSIYPIELWEELLEAACVVFDKMRVPETSLHLLITSGVSASAWSALLFPDPQVRIEGLE